MHEAEFYVTTGKERVSIDNLEGFRFVKISGWVEDFKAPDGSAVKIGLDETDEGWLATELTTGLLVAQPFQTRTEAIAALTPEFLQKIANAIKKPQAVKIANLLSKYIDEVEACTDLLGEI